jgi:hypothetical protein
MHQGILPYYKELMYASLLYLESLTI